ncbi:MAG TPA: carboxypeptidase regulatory-like domain-containing protein [Terracidiphilus sp.]|nr:carboxypeptidase regulatory-like domain-containing protein [Terracidiphilus sp.]
MHSRFRMPFGAYQLLLAILFLGLQPFVFAQGTSASLTGTVTDASGAAVAGASIKIVNTDTNFSQVTKSDGVGVYLLRAIPIGHYKLLVDANGFSKYQQEGLVLTTNMAATQNISLQVSAGKTEVVMVTSDAELVNTTSAELATTVGEAAISELPLNGRDPSSLVLLAPGTSNVRQHGGEGTQTGFSFDTESGASSNGGRQGSTFYMLDGVSNMDNYNLLTAPFPNSDATQEFKVITNNSGAQFGFAPGAVVSIATKGGTNSFHGGAFWFVRNNDLNASDWFSHSVDMMKRNQYGGYVGGPIIKNKLFFFGNFQGTKLGWTSSNLRTTTPTTAMLAGDFSGLGQDLNGPFALNPTTGNHDQLDTSIASLNAAAVTITTTGLPRGGSQTATGDMFYTQPALHNTYNEGTAKLDYTLSPSQALSLRSYTNYMTQPSVDIPGNMESVYNHQAWTAAFWEEMYYFNNVLSHSWTINPTTVNTLSVFWNQMSAHNGAQARDSSNKPMCLSRYININELPGSCYMGSLEVTAGYSIYSGWVEPSQEVRNTLGLVETVSKQLGKHSLTTGIDVMHQQAVENTQWPTQPTIAFNGTFTGNALADFMLGYAQEYMQGAGEIASVAGWQIGPFFQDDYRIRPNLTVNLGVRWDPNMAPTSAGARGAAFVAGQQSTVFPNAPKGLIFPGDTGMTATLMPDSYGYWEPRVGIAYQPSALPHTVIHAGFGMFTGPLAYSMYNHAADIAPFSPTFDFYGWCGTCAKDTAATGYINFSDPWSSEHSPVASSPFPDTYGWASTSYKPSSSFVFSSTGTNLGQSFSRDFKLGMTQSWSFSVEQQITPVMVVRGAYVGSQSYHQSLAIDLNTDVNWVAPYSQFAKILENQSIGTASYHALQLGFERKLSKGLQVQSNFTWSHAIDLAATSNVTYGSPALGNPFDLNWNRGNSSMDMPWSWVSNFIYRMPSLKNQGKLMNQVLGGWELSGIVSAQTGNPFSVMSGANNSGTNLWIDRADSVAGVSTNIGKGGRQDWAYGAGWFNKAAFTNGATFGDTGRNAYWGPGVFTTDAAIMKSWSLYEGTKLTFRWEAFNATNHPNFGNPDSSQWGGSHTGIISGLGNIPPRVMQGALKLTF